jgi:hypothetical protein
VENEKFAFPLVTLPVLLAEEPEGRHVLNGLLRNRLLWLAVLLCTVLHTARGLHRLYPSIPDIPLGWNLSEYLTTAPFNRLGWFVFNIYLLMIGLTFLLSLEVAFSLWFFFLFYKFEMLLAAVYNWDIPGPLGGLSSHQFHALQAFGGAVGLLAWIVWTARGHLRNVWEKAWDGPRASAIDDRGEMISYRGTLFGLLLSYGGIALWLYLAHVPAFLIVFSLLVMTLAFVVISWVVCQAGMLFMQMPFASLDILGGPWARRRSRSRRCTPPTASRGCSCSTRARC